MSSRMTFWTSGQSGTRSSPWNRSRTFAGEKSTIAPDLVRCIPISFPTLDFRSAWFHICDTKTKIMFLWQSQHRQNHHHPVELVMSAFDEIFMGHGFCYITNLFCYKRHQNVLKMRWHFHIALCSPSLKERQWRLINQSEANFLGLGGVNIDLSDKVYLLGVSVMAKLSCILMLD